MNKTAQNRIEEIKKNGYTLDFGNVFNQTFENYKKIALYAGLVFFVFAVVVALVGTVVLFSIFDSETIASYFRPENFTPENFDLNTILIVSTISVLITSLLSPLSAGLIKMAYYADKDEEFHLSTLFEYYKAPYLIELLIATFVVTLLKTIIGSTLNYLQIPLLDVIISIVVGLFTIVMIPLIIFGNLKAIEAIKASIVVVSKQPLTLLGLLVVGFIATMVGFIGCCIGVFFTLPFIYSLYFVIYREIIGFDTDVEPTI